MNVVKDEPIVVVCLLVCGEKQQVQCSSWLARFIVALKNAELF